MRIKTAHPTEPQTCVISEPDLMNTPESEILDGFSDQGCYSGQENHSKKSQNSCRCVIYEPDLMSTPESEILDGFSDQGVTQMCIRWTFFHGLYTRAEMRQLCKTPSIKFQYGN
ncbi:hypothetical protein TNCV_1182001 [Trichonephila clavipes]|nr:hypothetical protein TNCV_1182001 [Trichonephila clavipes]